MTIDPLVINNKHCNDKIAKETTKIMMFCVIELAAVACNSRSDKWYLRFYGDNIIEVVLTFELNKGDQS